MLQAVYGRVRRAFHELAKFGTIGAIALVVNVSLTNLIWHTVPNKPIVASFVGTVIATIVAYLGNRFWTYKDRDSIGRTRELVLFFAVNGVGMLIETVPLAFSQYILHFDGPLANNVAKFVFGMPLGMVFRLWTYRTWIFPKVDPALAPAQFQYGTGAPLPTSQLPTSATTRRSGSGDLLRTL
jgi:putative flippase GtrA